ncbi:Sphingoid long-chain base transporter RSB1 [Colletotrichum sp. SAR11_239]|nr:Sphingoid long-chain base transporter RSB1 [Colletotrichum sp. SAR 10_75]KAI8254048.1 Sphingoid long-chain base transporter RSB1 [Colletotrichum sp. SAR 10_77]KAI8267708.1 Sphingoid long-chain base transporter RSB1 [Colletotrichum sp. SAR11_239]KAJ5000014.1 Sphingoid long-chain base transporter RSB1 [Colletotrichum sp. SAR 10_66]
MSATKLPNGLRTFGPKANCTLELCPLEASLLKYQPSIPANICITVAPVFFCAAIYVMLSKVIITLDRSISRFNPHLFYYVFIPCDIISLILQATGGALSSIANDKSQVQKGVNVSLAGLIFQVVTLVVFCILFADYLFAAYRSGARERITKHMSVFLAFLFVSTILILVRCSYRIEELKEGYFSVLFRNEPLFIGLESS